MRILLTASPGVGHVLPILALAVAATERGHDVLVGTGADFAPLVERSGLRHVPLGPPNLPTAFGRIPGIGELTGGRRTLALVSQGFAGLVATEFASGTAELAARWRPDLIVREDMEMGSWIIAEQLGIPVAVVQATAWRPPMRRAAAEAQNALRQQHGLAVDPALDGHDGALWFTTRPPALRDPATPLPFRLGELRPEVDDRVGTARADRADIPDWLVGDTDRPRVAVTLGTVNSHRVDLLQPIVTGLSRLDVDVVVALGAEPATLGAVPDGVRVERFVPMSELLPRSTLVVHHSGSGTMLAAAAAGRPMLLVPIAADQSENATLSEAAGIGLRIEPEAVTPDAVALAARRLLDDPSFGQRAAAVANEVAAMPDAWAALGRIETMA